MENTATKTPTDAVKMQANNIDEQGNVLFLDQERLDSKLSPAPRFKNHPNGIGLYNFLKEHVIYVNNKSWAVAGKLYRLFVSKAKWLRKDDFKGKLYKKFIMLYPERETNTGTVVMPLNVDISDKSEKVTLPIDMLKESLKKIDYIAGMDVCLCREARICEKQKIFVCFLHYFNNNPYYFLHCAKYLLTFIVLLW